MSELKQTKGYVNFKGIIGGLDAIKDGTSKYGWTDDEKIKKMQFSIKTSDNNMHYVQLIQFKMGKSRENVWISRKDEATGKYDTQKLAWDRRNEPLTDGWRIIGVNIKATGDDETKSMVADDAIEYIKDNFNDGDSVFIGGKVSHSDWKGKTYHNFEITKMFATRDPVNFEDEKFEEISDFNEQFIFNSINVIENEGFVIGFTVSYNGDKTEVQYIIRDGEVTDYFKSSVGFGDLLRIEGIVNNKVVYKYRDPEKDEKDDGLLVGKQNRSSQQKGKIREIEYEDKTLEIIGVDDNVKNAYDEKELEIIDIDDDDIPF